MRLDMLGQDVFGRFSEEEHSTQRITKDYESQGAGSLFGGASIESL